MVAGVRKGRSGVLARSIRFLLASCAVLGSVSAADAQSWNGFYAGLNAGYGWNQDDGHQTTAVNTSFRANNSLAPGAGALSAALGTFATSPDLSGFAWGGQLGYNWKMSGSVVVSLEADWQRLGHEGSQSVGGSGSFNSGGSVIDVSQSAVVTKSIENLGTLRARAGLLVAPTVLAYITGGLAYGQVEANTSITQYITYPALNRTFPYSASGGISDTKFGWTIGGGVEWDFAKNWSLKSEYLYYDLGSVSYGVGTLNSRDSNGSTDFATTVVNARTAFTGHLARVGIN